MNMEHIEAHFESLQDDVAQLKGDVYGQDPERPGLSMRVYRMEQNLLVGYNLAKMVLSILLVAIPAAFVWRLLDLFFFGKQTP